MPDPRAPIPDEWVDAALTADTEWMRTSRSVVFVSPSRDQVRWMLRAAAPLVAAEAVAGLEERAEYWRKRWTAACERADQDGAQAISQHLRIRDLNAKLDEMAQCITTFLAVRGERAEAADLAEGLRQILGRDKPSSEGEGRG